MFLILSLACVPADTTDFEGGEFQLTTLAVDEPLGADPDDGTQRSCYDGAMTTVFMPEGTPNDFAAATYIPSWDELPATYSVELQDPFAEMAVTVDAGDDEGQMVITGAQQTGVLINEDLWADCEGDLSVDVDVTVVDGDTIDATATMRTVNVTGDTCPALTDPCDIVLTLSGTRVE